MGTDKKKVVLAYSGGLDTSIAIKSIQEKYFAIVKGEEKAHEEWLHYL